MAFSPLLQRPVQTTTPCLLTSLRQTGPVPTEPRTDPISTGTVLWFYLCWGTSMLETEYHLSRLFLSLSMGKAPGILPWWYLGCAHSRGKPRHYFPVNEDWCKRKWNLCGYMWIMSVECKGFSRTTIEQTVPGSVLVHWQRCLVLQEAVGLRGGEWLLCTGVMEMLVLVWSQWQLLDALVTFIFKATYFPPVLSSMLFISWR